MNKACSKKKMSKYSPSILGKTLIEMLEKELTIIRTTPKKDLPLLIGTMKFPDSQKLLEERIKE